MLTIDSITAEWHGESATVRALKTVTADDPYMRGHFPSLTVFPGVFTLELVRQVMLGALPTTASGARPRLETVTSLLLERPVLGGDRLSLEATVVPRGATGWNVKGRLSRRDGQCAARVNLEFVVA